MGQGWGGGRWGGWQPTSSGLYLHIHKPPTPVGCAGQPPLSPLLGRAGSVRRCLALRRGGPSLPSLSHRHQACLGRKPKSLPDHGSLCPRLVKSGLLHLLGCHTPPGCRAQDLDLPEGIFSVSNSIPSIDLASALFFFLMMDCLV